MRIAVVSLGRRVGSVFGYYATKALVSECSVVGVISQYSCNITDWRQLGVPLVEVAAPRTAGDLLRSSLRVWGMLQVRKQLLPYAPDVLYIPMGSPTTLVLCGLLRKIPLVVTEHDPVLHQGDHNLVNVILQSVSLRQATRIVVLSKAFVLPLVERGFREECIDVIPHGTFDCYQEKRAPYVRNERKPTLLFFGRIEPYKGVDILLTAFSLVKCAVPDARLWVVGAGELRRYRSCAEELGDVEVINRWVGDQEVARYFEGADAVVLPYTEATQSGVLAIAASFGLPAIASRVGGLPEQVVDGVNGLLVPPKDPQALAQACISVLTDRELRARLSKGAKGVAEGAMSWNRIGALIHESCLKAMRDHRGGDVY